MLTDDICRDMIYISSGDITRVDHVVLRQIKEGKPKNCFRNFLNGLLLITGRQRPYSGGYL